MTNDESDFSESLLQRKQATCWCLWMVIVEHQQWISLREMRSSPGMIPWPLENGKLCISQGWALSATWKVSQTLVYITFWFFFTQDAIPKILDEALRLEPNALGCRRVVIPTPVIGHRLHMAPAIGWKKTLSHPNVGGLLHSPHRSFITSRNCRSGGRACLDSALISLWISSFTGNVSFSLLNWNSFGN